MAYNDKPPLTSEFNIGRAARDGRLLLDQARRARTKKSSPTTAPTGDINIESGDGKGERGEREGSTNERRRSTAKIGESTRSGAKFCPSTVPQNKCGVRCEGRGAHMEEVGQPHAAVEERTTCVWNEGHGGRGSAFHSILTVSSQYPHSILTVSSQYPHEETRANIGFPDF